MKKIRILVDGISIGLAGIGNVITNIIFNMDKNKFEFEALLTYDSQYEPLLKEHNIPIKKICPFGKNIKQYAIELEEVYKNGHYDYVWVNNTGKVNVKIFKLAKKYGIRTIAHSHGESQEWTFKQKIVLGAIEALNQSAFYKNLDVAIACSKNSADYFYKLNRLKNKPLYVLENGIDLDKFVYDEVNRKKYRKILDCVDNIAIVTVGRICTVKNHLFLIDVMNKLKDNKKYKLFIIGKGEDEPILKNKIAEYGLEGTVKLLGCRNDVEKILSAFDVFVLPSLNEGYCVSLVEAHANGLQCLVSSTVKNPKYDENIYLNIENVDDWVNCIKSLDYRLPKDNIQAMKNSGLGIDSMAQKFEKILLDNIK